MMLPKSAQVWLPELMRRSFSVRPEPEGPCDIYFCLADHYEPGWRGAPWEAQRERVRAWIERYPAIAAGHRDADGCPPQHTFFFPEEEYHPEHLDALAALCRGGWGDVEVHLHHDGDTPQGLREKIERFTGILHGRHGLLRRDAGGALRYGFVHGNCALNNAHPSGRWCGVDDETSILLETGCYADFTMPSAPDPTQIRKINSIYYAAPRAGRRGHESGQDAAFGRTPPPGLLMVQGPLGLNWSRRKWGVLPRLENSEIAWHNPATPDRIRLWIRHAPRLAGAPQHVFVKVCTHGTQDRNLALLLEGGLERMWTELERICAPSGPFRLHYQTAYEMFRTIRQLECAADAGAGCTTPVRPAAVN